MLHVKSDLLMLLHYNLHLCKRCALFVRSDGFVVFLVSGTACLGVHWSPCGRYFGVLTSLNVHIHVVGGERGISIPVSQGEGEKASGVCKT